MLNAACLLRGILDQSEREWGERRSPDKAHAWPRWPGGVHPRTWPVCCEPWAITIRENWARGQAGGTRTRCR